MSYTGHGHRHGQPPDENSYGAEHHRRQFGHNYSGNAGPQTPISSPPPREPWGYTPNSSRNRALTQNVIPSPEQQRAFNDANWYQQAPYNPNPYPSPETPYRDQQHTRQVHHSPNREFGRERSSYFTPGKIFIVRWHEMAGQQPTGTIGSSEIIHDTYGNRIYSSWRRMIVIGTLPGHLSSTCVGIFTYGGKGLAKKNLDLKRHAVLFDKKQDPIMTDEEPEPLRDPLAVSIESPTEKLDPMSRVNFGKVHTIEHNVEICHIGRISTASMPTFNAYVNETWASFNIR